MTRVCVYDGDNLISTKAINSFTICVTGSFCGDYGASWRSL
jgi:hypothetical protein